jgi:hypothetical protein
MEALEIRYSNTPNRPTKYSKRAGKYTKGFLKWNRDQIRTGKTTIYADPTKIYNPKTDSFKTLKYKKSATKNKILTAASKRIKRNNNVMVDYIKIKLNKRNVPLNNDPYEWVKDIIKKKNLYRKKTRWVIKNNTNNDVLRSVELPALNERGAFGNLYSVSKYFKHQNDFMGSMMSPKSPIMIWWWLVYGDPDELIDLDEEEIFAKANFTDYDLYITEDINITEQYSKQVFRGEGDCLLRPIYDWIVEKHFEANSKAAKDRYATLKNHFHDKTLKSGVVKQGLFSKYPNGVPENDLPLVAEKCRVKIRIQKPFNEKVFMCAEPTKKALRTFSYTNTRLNHVEETGKDFFNNLYTNNWKEDIVIKDSYTEMNAIAASLEPGSWIGSATKEGVSTIKTLDTIYKVNQDFNVAVNEFEEEIGCNTQNHSWSFDSLKNPQLAKFIDAGTHFNGTIDFTEDIQDTMDNLIKQGLRHHDQTKAYANFNTSQHYSGFMERPADFRLTNKLEGKGFYYIYNIEFNNDKFKQLNNTLNWFKNHNVYTDAELKALSHYGATYKIAAAATGKKVDFKFNKTMKESKILLHKLENKNITLPYYSKWVGMCAMNKEQQTFLMKGEKSYFENIAEPGHTTIKYDDFFKGARITYPKKTAKTLKHIAAQIVAYQRLVMLDKVMEMDINKIVRICVDGIYFWEHDVDFSTPYDNENFKVWGDKTTIEKMTLENSPTINYLSNIYDANETMDTIFELNNGVNRAETLQDIIPLPTAKPRTYYRTELFTGQGGTGKTTYNLLDDGIIDVCYIAPTWKLARQMEADFKDKFNKNIEVNVLHRLLEQPHSDYIQKRYCNFVIDEASQITEFQKRRIFKLKHYRYIFCGDLGFQLPPVLDRKKYPVWKYPYMREMTKGNFDNEEHFTKIYRCKCPNLLDLLNYLRSLIEHKQEYKTCVPYLTKNIQKITTDELQNIYTKEDMILCSENKNKDEYTKMFSTIPKFMVKENTSKYNNNQIIFDDIPDIKKEHRHGFTIHSIQGETAQNKLFIDLRKQKSLRMIYTAISRAQYISQIYLI